MANLKALDGNGQLVYLEATGAGTEANPFKVLHSDVATQTLLDSLLTLVEEHLIELTNSVNNLETSLSTLNNNTQQTIVLCDHVTGVYNGNWIELPSYTDASIEIQATEVVPVDYSDPNWTNTASTFSLHQSNQPNEPLNLLDGATSGESHLTTSNVLFEIAIKSKWLKLKIGQHLGGEITAYLHLT